MNKGKTGKISGRAEEIISDDKNNYGYIKEISHLSGNCKYNDFTRREDRE